MLLKIETTPKNINDNGVHLGERGGLEGGYAEQKQLLIPLLIVMVS